MLDQTAKHDNCNMSSTYISRADGDVVPDNESGLMAPQATQSNPTDNHTLEKSPHAYSMPEEIATARRHRDLKKGRAKQATRPSNSLSDLVFVLIPVSAYIGSVLSQYLLLNLLSVETTNVGRIYSFCTFDLMIDRPFF